MLLRAVLDGKIEAFCELVRPVSIRRDSQLRSIAEKARTLGISEPKVKSRLRRDRLQMRQALTHLRATRPSERNHRLNSAGRRLRNPDHPVCFWPRSFDNEMGSIQ